MDKLQAFLSQANVLIVDDSLSNVQILTMMLKQNGYNVRNALSGELALQSARENPPDMILLNVNLPDMDGYQVCEILEVDKNIKKIPIIFISTNNETIDKDKIFTVGDVDYITKPFNYKEVLARAETHLKLGFMQQFNQELIKVNNDLENKVMERTQQLEEITGELKEFNVILEEEITNRAKREEEILYLSYHDKLTGLYNRRFYEEEIKRLDTERNLPMTIAMGDVNGLKLINDSFGHAMGDELLKKAAEAIKKGCRADDIIARLGGDEFVIILPKTDALETEKVIKRIKDLASKEKVGTIDISISFGYETKNNEKEKIQEVFKKAEDYMYKKKLFKSPSMREKTISAIISTLHEKNKKEEQHSRRVSALCKSMGEALGLPDKIIEELKSVGLLHDIGKIAIDENILNNSGKLTDDEWKEIKRHPEIGYRILSTVNDMSAMADYVLYHHERWDGKGYPRGLKGEDIPFVSRIIAIADAYDAITSEKNYISVLPDEVALEELQKNAGIQFDPKLVSVFIEKVLGK